MTEPKKDFDAAAAKLPLSGKRIVFTGELDGVTRRQAHGIAHELGADVRKSVSKKTDLVVVGADAGKKLQKAFNKGVKVVDEKTFFRMVRRQRKLEKALKQAAPKQ
jgi:DNA ligase (NAD+)